FALREGDDKPLTISQTGQSAGQFVHRSRSAAAAMTGNNQRCRRASRFLGLIQKIEPLRSGAIDNLSTLHLLSSLRSLIPLKESTTRERIRSAKPQEQEVTTDCDNQKTTYRYFQCVYQNASAYS